MKKNTHTSKITYKSHNMGTKRARFSDIIAAGGTSGDSWRPRPLLSGNGERVTVIACVPACVNLGQTNEHICIYKYNISITLHTLQKFCARYTRETQNATRRDAITNVSRIIVHIKCSTWAAVRTLWGAYGGGNGDHTTAEHDIYSLCACVCLRMCSVKHRILGGICVRVFRA